MELVICFFVIREGKKMLLEWKEAYLISIEKMFIRGGEKKKVSFEKADI